MTMFDILRDIIVTKSGDCSDSTEFDSVFSKFMVNRYLSMDRVSAPYMSGDIQIVSDKLSNKQYYKLLIDMIPKQKSSYIKYIKKTEKKTKSKETED